MANHKRHRPKHQRAGCLMCKPWKDERGFKGTSVRGFGNRVAPIAVARQLQEDFPRNGHCDLCLCAPCECVAMDTAISEYVSEHGYDPYQANWDEYQELRTQNLGEHDYELFDAVSRLS